MPDAQAAHVHQADPAQAQTIEKAFAGLGRTRMERQLQIRHAAADPYGVTRRRCSSWSTAGQSTAAGQYAVGDVAPDGLSRYVLALGGPSVVTIANYQIDNLLNLIQAVGEKPAQGLSRK